MAQRFKKQDVRGSTRFYRPAYEAIAAVSWFLGAIVYIAISRLHEEGIAVVGYAAVPMLLFAFVRGYQAVQIWHFKLKLTEPPFPWTTVEKVVARQVNSSSTFLAKGFDWQPFHARMMREISTIPLDVSLKPPEAYRRFMRAIGLHSKTKPLEGKHYIHGCNGSEENLFVSDRSRSSHTIVLGTNGAGKTRMLETLVVQSISRGHISEKQHRQRLDAEYTYELARAAYQTARGPGSEASSFSRAGLYLKSRFYKWALNRFPARKYGAVFILDPKGDPDLRDRAYATAKMFGRESKFYYFSPTNAGYSFRVNPLANYQRRTEIANRISALLPSGGDSDAFKQFAWRAINVVVEGLDMAKIPITLLNIREHIESGIHSLIIKCIERHVANHSPLYNDYDTKTASTTNRMAKTSDLDPKTALRAVALAAYYKTNIKPKHPSTTIDGMIEVMTHDSQHYSKLISNLIPVLVQLTTGSMEHLLSDPPAAAGDARPLDSFAQLIHENAIVYISFESLADSVVGSALGSLFIADLTACAANRHHNGISEPPVSIFIDEAAEMMNDPFIQALNKGRSAGFELTLASQTIADFVARMGNQAKAMQVLGNVNTTIAMRLIDNESAQMVSDKFADTTYEEKTSSRTSTTISPMAKRGRDFSGSVMKNTQTSDLPLVTADLLSSLPPGHFFGHLPGARKVKGRVLMMPLANEDRFVPQKHGRTKSQYPLRLIERKYDQPDVLSEETETVILDHNYRRSHDSHISNVSLPSM